MRGFMRGFQVFIVTRSTSSRPKMSPTAAETEATR